MKNEKLIPPGPYCYVIDLTAETTIKEQIELGNSLPTVFCPYSTYKEFNGVKVPWCSFLEQGGISNNTTEEEFDKLIEYFGSENNVFDFLYLDLLWDDCKECGVNDDYSEFSKEKCINYINEIKNENISDNL